MLNVSELLVMSDNALDTDNEDVDPSFDFRSSLKEDNEHTVESFCENYALQFNRDERVELGCCFFAFNLKSILV